MEKYIVASVLGTASGAEERQIVKEIFPQCPVIDAVTFWVERQEDGVVAQIQSYENGVLTLIIGPFVEPLIG